MPSKAKVHSRKTTSAPTQGEEPAKPPVGWPDTDGLSGEGAESAMVHLREMEKQRNADKDRELD